MDQEEVLQIFKEAGALQEGHFELRSGLHSPRYIQCANVLRHPRLAGKLCEGLAAKVRAGISGDLPVDTVIAPAIGGIVVGHELARVWDVPSIFTEKQDGALVLKRFNISQGERFIVAEDVVTRGGRVQETVNIVENHGGNVAAIALLVDRSGGQATFDYPVFSLLHMDPVTYEPDECPLCTEGLPLVHPGS